MLALSYAAAARRPALAALWQLDERMGSIVAAARDPLIGSMRLVWWRDALGWRDVWRTEVRRHAIIAPDDGSGWQMCFIAVPDPTPGKNKLHLDFSCPDREAEAERLVAAGARLVRRDAMDGDDYGWIVMADPEGNLFCVSSRGR